MSGSDADGAPSPPLTADLQPAAGLCALSAPEHHSLLELRANGFDKNELARARDSEDSLVRLASDHIEVERLREAGFAGPGYETFKAVLAFYGLPVMEAWIRRRDIFRLTYDRGRPVNLPYRVGEHLERDADDRQQLAGDVVTNALVFFRTHALINGKWTPTGGASITTYFAGACISVFPNAFRAWLKEFEIDHDIGTYELDPDVDQPGRRLIDPRISEDPADVVANRETFRDALDAATSPQLRNALAAVALHDTPYADIAKQEGTTENAIKQQLYRYREQRRKQGGRG